MGPVGPVRVRCFHTVRKSRLHHKKNSPKHCPTCPELWPIETQTKPIAAVHVLLEGNKYPDPVAATHFIPVLSTTRLQAVRMLVHTALEPTPDASISLPCRSSWVLVCRVHPRYLLDAALAAWGVFSRRSHVVLWFLVVVPFQRPEHSDPVDALSMRDFLVALEPWSPSRPVPSLAKRRHSRKTVRRAGVRPWERKAVNSSDLDEAISSQSCSIVRGHQLVCWSVSSVSIYCWHSWLLLSSPS